MNRVLIFDADGVAVAPREKYFSQRFMEDYGVPSEAVMPLFKNEFLECVLGKKSLTKVLEEKYVALWQWQGTIDELLDYWFAGENTRNEPVLALIAKLRTDGYQCYLATDQVRERKDYLLGHMKLAREFDGTFFSCDLGVSKSTAEYWQLVLTALSNPDPKAVYFWDDEMENVTAAKSVGINASFYTGIEDIRENLSGEGFAPE